MAFSVMGLGLALCVALLLTPLIRKASIREGLLAVPNGRNIHKQPIPRLGGIAIFFAILLPLLLLLPLGRAMQGFLAGLTVLAILGVIDDIRGLDAWTKLPVQILASWMLVVFGGVKILYLDFPLMGTWLPAEWLSNLLTMFCIIALINAVNLIDGLDGLASGTATLVFVAIALLGLKTDNTTTTVLAATFIGANLGFLWYNRHPATIFMGDTGSTILGFGLAYACLDLVYTHPHTISTWVPFGLLALPVFDTGWAFTRRIINGLSPFRADKSHVHHRLLSVGIPHSKAVWILCGLTALLCTQATLLAQLSNYAIMGLTLVTLGVFYLLIQALHSTPPDFEKTGSSQPPPV